MSVRTLDQFVFGTGDDDANSLLARIKAAWATAKDPAFQEKVGKSCDVISVVANIEGKEPRQLFNREIRVDESPETVASFLRKELGLDPGDAFNGTIRFYFRVFGATEAGKLGSFQREIRASELPATDASGNIVQIQTALITPLVDKIKELADVNVRMVSAHASVIESVGKGAAVAVEIMKGNRVAESANPIMAFLGQAVSAAGGAGGVPGAQQAGRALTAMAKPSTAPPTYLPDFFSKSGVTKTAVPEYGLTDGKGGAAPTPGAPAPAAGSAAPTSSSSSSSAPPKITRADVERWSAENPEEAEDLVKAKLRARGFPV